MRGMISLIFLLNCWALATHAQDGFINNGAEIYIYDGADLRVEGSVYNKNSGKINNDSRLFLQGDWLQSGTSSTYSGNGVLEFNGTANQRIKGLDSIRLLCLNNGNNLILADDLRIYDSLMLSNNGSIQLKEYNLTLSEDATILGYDKDNYIITDGTGSLRFTLGILDSFFTPIGRTTYNPAQIKNTGVKDVYDLRIYDSVLTNGTSGLPVTYEIVNRTWKLEEAMKGGSNIEMKVFWQAANELSGFNRNNCGISHYDSSLVWDQPVYSAANNEGGGFYSISRSGISSFSPFVVEGNNHPLPIELLTFQAKRINSKTVLLEWATATELNNSGFEIQRSLDGLTFESIDWIDGNGTTTAMHRYTYNDLNNEETITYYRLKQLDDNGSFSYSPIRTVEGAEISVQTEFFVFPNPTHDQIFVSTTNFKTSSISLNIYSMDGKIVRQEVITTNSGNKVINLQHLLPGTYIIKMMNEETVFKDMKLIKL